jgi:hypothetical protein
VKQLGVIQKIIASIYDDNGELVSDITELPDSTRLARRVFTPINDGLVYFGNTLKLYRPYDIVSQTIDTVNLDVGETYAWKTYIDLLGGTIKDGITEVRLEQPNGSTLVGSVAYHPTDRTLLIFNPYNDTIPSNTLMPVNAIIDPYNVPVDTSYLGAAVGTRYLILNDIGSVDNLEGALAWRGSDGSNLVAKENDIIEFDGVRWFVAFAAADSSTGKYCVNLKTGLQFKWTPEEQSWTKSIEGEYPPGQWTIIL